MNADQATERAPSIVGERYLPRDRESFFDAQKSNRRATWRMSVLCVLGAILMGIPLALITTPLIYGLGMIIADTVNLFSPLPPEFWQQANQLARFGQLALQSALQHEIADPQAIAIGAAVILVPGMLLSYFLWFGLNLLFRRCGTGGALLALGAREPNQAELKELQLADIVQEMAIAAGLPAPRVMIIDSPGANAGIVGASPEEARIVVSRAFLECLTREEVEGALAHLIASIGNGDLRIAVRMTSVLEAGGLLLAIINSPFGPQSRRTLWRLVRHCLGARRHDEQDAATVADLLNRSANLDTDDIDHFFDSTGKHSRLRSIRNFLFFPIFFTNAAVKLLLWFFSLAILGPSLALLWHTRQYLADACAVQLTRNPDALASALQKLSDQPGEIPGGGNWAARLFLVRPGHGEGRSSPSLDVQQRALLAQAWSASAPGAISSDSAATADFASLSRQFSHVMQAAMSGDPQALARLRAAYQSVATADPALANHIPNPDDLIAARRGDFQAMARLRAAHGDPAKQQSQNQDASSDSVGFIPFHPSLKRRLKRLARLGAHLDPTAARDSKATLVIVVLSLLLGPFMLLAVALLIFLIVVMTLASLTFVVIWLATLHQLFVLAGSPVS